MKMVKEDYYIVWICPYCDREYDEECDARYCANNCADIESPEEKEVGKFTCEYCNEIYEEYDDAFACEEAHIKNEDIHHINFEAARSFDKLKEAAEHPFQTRII